eukprot:1146092-Pelagomonas_calceolata.AAC.6
MRQVGQRQSHCPRMFTSNMPRDVHKQTQHCPQSLLTTLLSPQQRRTWLITCRRKSSKNKALKSLKTAPGKFLARLFRMVLAPLPDTKAVLM